jgi:hypothetical protein
MFASLVFCARKWRPKGIHVWCVQEHNLDPSREDELRRLAQSCQFGVVFGFASQGQDGTHWGGTLILYDEISTTLKKDYSSPEGITKTSLTWNDRDWEIVSVYAPVTAPKRIDFFNDTLKKHLTPDSIAGGDWNCVPDVTLDATGRGAVNYRNIGAAALNTLITANSLDDIHREQLGNERETTRIGTTIATRLDRWYAPMNKKEYEDILWSVDTRSEIVPKRATLDHKPLLLLIETKEGEAGHERHTVNEQIALEPGIQTKLDELFRAAYAKGGNERTKWERAHASMRDFLLKETSRRRARDSRRLKLARAMLKQTERSINRRGTSEALRNIRNKQLTEIHNLEHPEKSSIHEEAQAQRCAERSDKCTRLMFMSYKQIAKQQFINKVKTTNEWKEGEEPTFNGHTTAPSQVCEELKKYYTMLFGEKKPNEHEMNKILKQLKKRKLFSVAKDKLDTPITVDEIIDVMEHLPLGKQAGPDRIPNAVYKFLPKTIAPKLKALIDESITKGELPTSMIQGDIGLLYKKKERDEVRNYRPITLLQNAYKIYTRVLTRRMRDVVHQFVTEQQKGFVPKAFIAECSMLLNLVEAHINDEPLHRKGLFLFLDMEKAFDRCSYEYMNKALDALGFGQGFQKYINLMYNVESPPQRRIYANGYYSDWFPIKSGVAQGCPLSPLLFLLIAEGLNVALDNETRRKNGKKVKAISGIKVGDKRYKLSQYADDTTLLLRNTTELKYAFRAVKRWGLATGMRENITKREGLALGKYRHPVLASTLPTDIKWVPEGEFAVGLGIPIGNDLDANKWWKKKLDSLRDKTKRWGGLYRSSYYGRNLVVQAMFYGSLRYWLYSLPMPPNIAARIQDEANILLWSKEPDLDKQPIRYRRFVAARTAIGPVAEGGLGALDWTEHVHAFQAEWILKYLHPGNAGWKDVLDAILLYDKRGNLKFPEGRKILLCNMTNKQKAKLLRGLPKPTRRTPHKGAQYLRQCLKSFWKLDLKQDLSVTRGIAAEPLWNNNRFKLTGVLPTTRQYFSTIIDVTTIGDVIDNATDRPFTKAKWMVWIRHLHNEEKGEQPDRKFVRDRANEILAIVRQIPTSILNAAKKPQNYTPKTGEVVALACPRGEEEQYEGALHFARKEPPGAPSMYHAMWRDSLGTLHETGRTYDFEDFEPHPIEWWEHKQWDKRACGPVTDTFPLMEGWLLNGEQVRFDSLRAKNLTKALTYPKFIRPASEKTWNEKLNTRQTFGGLIPFNKVWKRKSTFATPRDKATGVKLLYRNLYVGARQEDPQDRDCRACDEEESMLHLAECAVIQREFWGPLLKLLKDTGSPDPTDITTFLATTAINTDKVISKYHSVIWYLGWRCLYAATVESRIDKVPLDLEKALKRCVAMLIGRLRAFGKRWKDWVHSGIQHRQTKIIPLKHRNKELMTQDEYGEYTIHPAIWQLAGDLNLIAN